MKLGTIARWLVVPLAGLSGWAQAPSPQGPGEVRAQILEQEHGWAKAIQRQDGAAMSGFLAEGYVLIIGTPGKLRIVPRTVWLDTLKAYVTKAFTMDDVRVEVHGETAVAAMICTQEATVHGQDRSAQFVITDVWVKTPAGWRVAERHSSRPEPAQAARP